MLIEMVMVMCVIFFPYSRSASSGACASLPCWHAPFRRDQVQLGRAPPSLPLVPYHRPARDAAQAVQEHPHATASQRGKFGSFSSVGTLGFVHRSVGSFSAESSFAMLYVSISVMIVGKSRVQDSCIVGCVSGCVISVVIVV